eukprot:TRINITY_DN1675_c0_g1_i2.p1 TRINITY_DN1675_c0_g1~~TRINITY_DN1675_c0_g1_i2.p1  ORF type:complete len:242 (+),score=28.55 TRINITY_DN1675_c0_g1_i2:41-766(+)
MCIRDRNYYHINLFTSTALIIQVNQLDNDSRADCDLYIKGGSIPNYMSYDYVKLSTEQTFNISIPNPMNITWYLGVFGWTSCKYEIKAVVTGTCQNNCSGNGVCTADGTCSCNSGWSGPSCSDKSSLLSDGVTVSGSVSFNTWDYYTINVSNAYQVDIHMKENGNSTESGALWLYESSSGYPTMHTYDYSDTSVDDKLHSLKIVFANPPVSRQLFIGVYGSPILHQSASATFQLVAWYPNF